MSFLLHKCKNCRLYTFSSTCPKCSGVTSNPHPLKYSVEDRLAKYRRQEKFSDRIKAI